jgi:hypothetical protein
VDQFHGVVDQQGSQSTMDRNNGAVAGSPELTLEAAPMSEKGEEL